MEEKKMMDCEFKNCKESAFTCGNVICYSEDGDFENVCLCKKHCLMFVPKKLREVNSKGFLERFSLEQQLDRFKKMINITEELIERRDLEK